MSALAGFLGLTGGTWTLPVGSVAVFGALALAGRELVQPRVRRRHLAVELGMKQRQTPRTRVAALGTQATALAERALDHYDREGRLGAALDRAGINLRPAEFVAMAGAVVVGAVLVTLLLAGPIIALAVGALTAAGFRVGVTVQGTKRRNRFEDQLGDALQMLSGGLRAGHSLTQAMDALVREAESPTRDEFQRVLFEARLGHPLPTAMRNVAERVRSEDLDQVVEAIEIQRDVGGDLAELLDNVTDTIRDRRRVDRQITTLTAEGRLSAVILFCLPLVMFGYMAFANRSYLNILTSSFAGVLMLVGAGVLMVAGGLWLRRIVRLQY